MAIKDITFPQDRQHRTIEVLAPRAIITAAAGVALDVTGYGMVGAPVSFEFYINADTTHKITYPGGGTIPIHDEVSSLTFTADTTLVVM